MPRVSQSNNKKGTNQHHSAPLLEQYPNLPDLIQEEINRRTSQKDLPAILMRKHGIKIGLRKIEQIIHDYSLLTTRRNGLTKEGEALAIGLVTQEDPLGRKGKRIIQEQLGLKGIHIPREQVAHHLRAQNPAAVAARCPGAKKVHSHGLWSIGPNEEWGVDGHEKLAQSMGISVWGIVDKWSRIELSLYAMPNARIQELPPALYLRTAKKYGGMPLTTTTDKGTELGTLIQLISTLRQKYQPYIPEEHLPAVKTVKSVFNITRERSWRPLYEKDLANILHFYRMGRVESGFMESDPIHSGISYWLWGRVVQLRLDELIEEKKFHKVKHQKNILLPSGAQHIEMYESPERWGGEDQLIPIPAEDIDNLLTEYDRPDLLQFGSDEMVELCEAVYDAIGAPKLSASVCWEVFKAMVHYYCQQSSVPN